MLGKSIYLIKKNVPYVFVESKKALGKACGISRKVITVSILKNKKSNINDEIIRIKEEYERLFINNE